MPGSPILCESRYASGESVDIKPHLDVGPLSSPDQLLAGFALAFSKKGRFSVKGRHFGVKETRVCELVSVGSCLMSTY